MSSCKVRNTQECNVGLLANNFYNLSSFVQWVTKSLSSSLMMKLLVGFEKMFRTL